MRITRALLSVSDKTGIVAFAEKLHSLGIEIISTGGTLKVLKDAGIPVKYVSEITGFPEIMDGRVKTLNPYIHGGILSIRDNEQHVKQMQEHGIKAIDMVVVNLYPFRQTIAKPNVQLDEAIENIDIGGPAMIRAAAKNFKYVTVVVNPKKYGSVIEELEKNADVSFDTRQELAKEAYAHTAAYDACIAAYLSQKSGEGQFPDTYIKVYEKVQDLRYGENPHQQAAFYREQYKKDGLANLRQLHGKELSFNNIVDLESAYRLVSEFDEPAAAIIKHTNPCGTGIGTTLCDAYIKAYEADPVSAFGGIIALNREVDELTANEIAKIFVEAIVAPKFSDDALKILVQKKNIRLIETDIFDKQSVHHDIKSVLGGMVVQELDVKDVLRQEMKVVTRRQPTTEEWKKLLFAWKTVKHVKSNAIVITSENQTLGIGAGQMNRVGSAKIAIEQAKDKTRGQVMASDAFFPFRDTVDVAAEAGITAIIQPGGSVRDEESIQAADEHNMAMVFTGMRHFKH